MAQVDPRITDKKTYLGHPAPGMEALAGLLQSLGGSPPVPQAPTAQFPNTSVRNTPPSNFDVFLQPALSAAAAAAPQQFVDPEAPQGSVSPASPDIFKGLAGLGPLVQQSLAGPLGLAGSMQNYMNPPAAEAGPTPDVNALLSSFLSGLNPGANPNDVVLPGGAMRGGAEAALPRPPKLKGADYSQALKTLEGAKPPEAPLQTSDRTYPGALTPEEQEKMVSTSGWGAAAKAAMAAGPNAGIADLILQAGLGGLAGRSDEKNKLAERDQLRQEKQFAYETDREDRNLDRQDKHTHDMMTYTLQMAGVQGEQAKSMADAAIEQQKMEYNYLLKAHEDTISSARAYQPKVINMGDKGVAVQYMGPDGVPHLQMHPLHLDDMGGLGGSAGDLQDLQSSGGDPAMAAKMLVRQLDRQGMLPPVFGEHLGEIENEVNKTIPADLRTMGTEGDKEWLRRSKAERDWKLAEGLLSAPNLLQQAVGLLRKK